MGAAITAFPGWRDAPGAVRATFLRRIAAGLEVRRGASVALQMLNNGKPGLEAEVDVSDAIATFA